MATLRAFTRYAVRLPGFLRSSLAPADCAELLRARLERREASFLRVLERGVYGNPRSPYRPLLEGASIEYGDVVRLLRDGGVEGALEQLYDAGVHVTQDELKRRRPIERLGVDRSFTWGDFDNPFSPGDYVGTTGGSRSAGRRVHIDLERLAQGAVYHGAFLRAFDLEQRPHVLWRAAPPALAGFNATLQLAKVGRPVERWFSPTPLWGEPRLAKDAALVAYTVAVGRVLGARIRPPVHVPAAEAVRVARWAAERRAAGTPALVSTTASSGVRLCLAAADHGLDIEGTFFRLGGEPYTSGRAAVIAAAGARAVPNYSMSEVGRVGVACTEPAALDDLHLAVDSLGVIQRDHVVAGGERVGALVVTTLLPSAPKLLLNVATDDYGTLGERDCGCYWAKLGFTRHVEGVRSHEKLTSEGMNFAGTDVIVALEETLPARFGGGPTDYQLVEEEVEGLPRVTLVVSPRVGPADDDELAGALVAALAQGPGYRRMMAHAWRDAGIVRVERREPYATAAGKIQPLHVRGAR